MTQIPLKQISDYASAPIDEAESLPFFTYTDQDVYDLETRRIFHSDWVFICNEFAIPKPGDRFAFKLAEEPVVIIRGKDGDLRALSNTCRHRGTLLADDGFSSGTTNLVCPYHSWNFTEDGDLRGAPMTGNVKIDKKKHCLPRFQLTVWHGLVFINLDPNASPLEDRLAGIEPYMAPYEPEQFNSGYEQESDHWATNWKLAYENAAESYHLFKVHKPTLETVTPTKDAFYIKGGAEWSVTGGKTRVPPNLPWWQKWFYPTERERNYYILLALPPSFVGILSSDGVLGYIAMLPEGPGRTYVRGGGVGKNLTVPTGMVKKFVDDFFAEDKFICERAYSGMSTKLSEGGKLVELERIVADFHQYLANRLFDVPIPETHVDKEGNAIVGVDV